MKRLQSTFQAVIVLVAVTAFAASLSAQQFPSKWNFGKKYNQPVEASWSAEGCALATDYGTGLLKAVKADGTRPDTCFFDRYRPIAGPVAAGDYIVLEFSQTTLPKGSFVEFDMTLSAYHGAPSLWQFEYFDGGQWVSGDVYKLYSAEYQYTSVLETIRLSADAEGSLKMRLKALESKPVRIKDPKLPQAEGCVVIQTHAYLGAYVQDLGVVPPKDTTKVLCIGNSFTYYCSCPSLLKEIAWCEGHYLDVAAALKGGRNFDHHLRLNITADAIQKGGYDLAIMQDQSQGPARLAQDKETFGKSLECAVELSEKIKAASPQVKFMVESTWAYSGKKKDYGEFGDYKTFDKLTFKGATMMAKAIGDAKVSRIEAAFALVREERPDINLYSSDLKHQSLLGSYLKSCVNYLTIFGEPFGESPADCGLDSEIAAYLRTAAERTVLKQLK